MKKKLAALLVLATSVFALTACGENDTTSEVQLPEATVTPSIEVVEVEGNLSELPVEEYVVLGDYSNLNLSIPARTEMTEEELDAYVMEYFYYDASFLAADNFVKEGTVADGDVVLIDYEGKLDGVAFDGGTATDATLGIGSGQFIDGFEEGLVGVEVGETVDLNLTFPESYSNTDLAGQDVVFTVTVKGLVSFNDDTVKAIGREGYDTAEAYRAGVEAFAAYEIENQYYTNLGNAICNELLNICTVNKIPKNVYVQGRTAVIEQLNEVAAYYGMDSETYAQLFAGMTLADYSVIEGESYAAQAVIFQAIANAEGIAPTEEDVDAYASDYVTNYGEVYGIDSVKSFYEYFDAEEIENYLMQQNVIGFIADSANITETE